MRGVLLVVGLVVLCIASCGEGDICIGWQCLEETGTDDGGEVSDLTYYMGEDIIYYPTGPCSNTILNDVTSEFASALAKDGWVGDREYDSTARAIDWVDFSVGGVGEDDLSADSARLAVYAGHGYMNRLAFATIDPALISVGESEKNSCSLHMDDYVRLGDFEGNQASTAVVAASCVGYSPGDDDIWFTVTIAPYSPLNQWMMFHDSPLLPNDTLRVFFENQKQLTPFNTYEYESNLESWFGIETHPGAEAAPVVYTGAFAFEDISVLSGRHEEASIRNLKHLERHDSGYTDWTHSLSSLASDCPNIGG